MLLFDIGETNFAMKIRILVKIHAAFAFIEMSAMFVRGDVVGVVLL